MLILMQKKICRDQMVVSYYESWWLFHIIVMVVSYYDDGCFILRMLMVVSYYEDGCFILRWWLFHITMMVVSYYESWWLFHITRMVVSYYDDGCFILRWWLFHITNLDGCFILRILRIIKAATLLHRIYDSFLPNSTCPLFTKVKDFVKAPIWYFISWTPQKHTSNFWQV